MTHLWNFDEYAKNETSPRPELKLVRATPVIAIQLPCANATSKYPANCVQQITKTRTLWKEDKMQSVLTKEIGKVKKILTSYRRAGMN